MKQRNLRGVAPFCAESGFTEPQLRWWIHNAEANGLARAGAIVRIQRRVYVDVDRFWAWVDSGSAGGTATRRAGASA